MLARSEFGRGNNTEPQQILRRLAKSDAGLRQLCQIVLDGRGRRDPQELPDGAEPLDKRIRGASILTAEQVRELVKLSEEGISHDSPKDQFTAAIVDFEVKLDELHYRATKVANVLDNTGVPLVDAKGYESGEVKTTLQDIVDLVAEWRSARRRAVRMRPDLDDNKAGR